MAWYPQSTSGLGYVTSPAGPTADGTTITASGSTNTKGSYTQFTASTSADSNSIIVNILRCAGAARYLVDLATGAAASEVVVIPNIMIDNATSGSSLFGSLAQWFPLQIASSTRVSMRCQSSVGSNTVVASLTYISAGGVNGQTSFTNYGASTGDSGGTSIDPGGTANTKGSYTQITSSTSAVAQWLTLICAHDASDVSLSNQWSIDIATGAGGAEVVLIPDIRTGMPTNGSGAHALNVRNPCNTLTYIAASTRIAARASDSQNTGGDRLIDVALYTCVAPSEPSSGGGAVWGSA